MPFNPMDDPIKTAGIMALAAWVAWLAGNMRKVIRLWNEHPQKHLSVRNGEYVALVQTLGEIMRATQQLVTGQGIIVDQVDKLTRRMDTVETRLP